MKLYIDPGTASMLFTALIGLISILKFGTKSFFAKFTTASIHKNKDTAKIPFVIFSDDKRYWQTFKPICEELNKEKFDITYITLSKDDPVFQEQIEHLHPKYIGSKNATFAYMNHIHADIVLSTTPGLDVYQWKRSKYVKKYIHITHSCLGALYRMFGIAFYDAILLSGEYQCDDIHKLEETCHSPRKETIVIGSPYMDELKKKYDSSNYIENKTKNILIAPTWNKQSLFHKNINLILDSLLKTNYHIIIRPHPQSWISEKKLMDELTKKYPSSDKIEWDKTPDNFETLKKTDLMISDYSGVIFDFAFVFNKPIIISKSDIQFDACDNWWLNNKEWAIDNLPNIGTLYDFNTDLKNIDDVISQLLDNNQNNKTYATREKSKNEAWFYQNMGAKNATKYIIDTYRKLNNENCVTDINGDDNIIKFDNI